MDSQTETDSRKTRSDITNEKESIKVTPIVLITKAEKSIFVV